MYSLIGTTAAVFLAILLCQVYARNGTGVPKQSTKKIYVHLMPWFETRQTNTNGNWGIHWTMDNQNPDMIVGENEKRQIASHYYPDIHPYGSGDSELIDYQIQMMRYAGVDGVFMDWPGTTNAWDYPKNMQNADNFINKLEAAGLDFAVVYEDHNLGMAYDAGLIPNILEQGRRDMEWLRDNYFGKTNYVKIDGNPLLMTFGPQTLKNSSDWEFIFGPLAQKPTFLTLWYQTHEGGNNSQGEYAWIYNDFMDGLKNYYTNRQVPIKCGVAYPGFATFYSQGGWSGPDWAIAHDGLNTFAQTLNLALGSDVPMVQVATWNNYGEGTMIEPTREFGNGFLNVLQHSLKVPYGNRELNLIKSLYEKRKMYKGRDVIQTQLNNVNEALNNLQPDKAEELLNNLTL